MNCSRHQVSSQQNTDEQPAGNVLFLAVYLFSHKDLRSKIEQNVVISLLLYVKDDFVNMLTDCRDEADLSTVFASEAFSSVTSHTSLGQKSEDGCFRRA